jgi:hypothetical protein
MGLGKKETKEECEELRWAGPARQGKQVIKFLENGRNLAVVVGGKVHIYK